MNEKLIQETIAQFKTKISGHIRPRALRQHTGEPELREDRLFFLLLPFLNGDKWNDEQEQSAVSVALIYSALAAHDQIEELNASSKSQQLTVLAGDYYSGLYYQLLAKIGNVELIRTLSNGVIGISENKASVYGNVTQSFQGWMQTIQTIESLSIEQYYGHFSNSQYQSLARHGLQIYRIQQELELAGSGITTRFQQSLAASESQYRYPIGWLEMMKMELAKLKKEMLEEILNSSVLSNSLQDFLVGLYGLRLTEKVSAIRER